MWSTGWCNWYLKRRCRKFNIRNGGHSQYGQDVTVFDLLGRPSAGTYLDIGANDGRTYSNSLLLEEKGWSGICVEPHPVVFETLKKNRRGHLVNACILDTDGKVDFLVVEGPANMLSGIAAFMDAAHLERIDREIAQKGGSKRIVPIEAISPATLCRRFAVERIDYLSIDTEGCELSILKSFDFDKIFVRLIGTENSTRSPAIFRYLISKGYRLVKTVGCDEIYRNCSVRL